MKHLLAIFALASALCAGGCADEGPTSDELQEQVGRGLRGEGTLSTDIDRSSDPYVKPREGAPAPRE